jgi:hypothetical protein
LNGAKIDLQGTSDIRSDQVGFLGKTKDDNVAQTIAMINQDMARIDDQILKRDSAGKKKLQIQKKLVDDFRHVGPQTTKTLSGTKKIGAAKGFVSKNIRKVSSRDISGQSSARNSTKGNLKGKIASDTTKPKKKTTTNATVAQKKPANPTPPQKILNESGDNLYSLSNTEDKEKDNKNTKFSSADSKGRPAHHQNDDFNEYFLSNYDGIKSPLHLSTDFNNLLGMNPSLMQRSDFVNYEQNESSPMVHLPPTIDQHFQMTQSVHVPYQQRAEIEQKLQQNFAPVHPAGSFGAMHNNDCSDTCNLIQGAKDRADAFFYDKFGNYLDVKTGRLTSGKHGIVYDNVSKILDEKGETIDLRKGTVRNSDGR